MLTPRRPRPRRGLRYGNHADQVVDVWYAHGVRPLVVLHARWLLAAGVRPQAPATDGEALADLGWPVVSLEYRREPGEPDASPSTSVRRSRRCPTCSTARGYVLVGHSAGRTAGVVGGLDAKPGPGPRRARAGPGRGPGDGRAAGPGRGRGTGLHRQRRPQRPGPGPAASRDRPGQRHPRNGRRPGCRLASPSPTSPPTPPPTSPGWSRAGHFELIDPLTHAWHDVTAELTRLPADPPGSGARAPARRTMTVSRGCHARRRTGRAASGA